MTDKENNVNEEENNTGTPAESPTLLGETIEEFAIEKEISQSYIEYAMSVIVSRALPDTRDGLKPVLRRILFAMYNDLKVFHNTKYKKSARIVGDVLGKYHPHGDSSVYEAMVRLAQPFAMRYPLVDGQGNFGSIDGDGAAAPRYTEARLTKLAEQMMKDIEQDTVDRRDNYDGTMQEPIMLSTRFPNHLCNGTMGIAVGMATNMAPHNLNEVIDASLLMLKNEDTTIDEIMEIIKGPDFPTGGVMFDHANIVEVYKKGRGGIVCRGKVHVETQKNHEVLVIDEIPYLVNKSKLVEKIGELVVDKKIEGVTDIRDESNKGKIRVTIHIKPGANTDKILVQIYKRTDLQSNFNINNVTLIDGGKQPRTLNIRDLILEFVTFRRKVVYRRSVFQLKKAQDRLHILEGLKKAIDVIDEVIETIKKSDTKQDAKENLMNKFEFSEVQAEYILMMRLQSLVGLEIQRILEEIEEKKKLIEYLEGLINSPEKLDEVVRDEMIEIKDKFGDKRRTELSSDLSVYNLSASLKDLRDAADRVEEDVIFLVENDYSVRVLYQSRILAIPEETIDLIYTHNQDKVVVITDRGELVIERLKDLGSHSMKTKALNLKDYFGLKGNIIFAKTLHVDYEFLCLLTDKNNLKKIKKELLLSFKKFPTVVMNLDVGEKIVKVEAVDEGDKLGVVTKQGRMLIFPHDDLRPMGKTAGGVKSIDLQDGDKVVNMFLYQDEPFIMVFSKRSAKMLSMEDLRIRKRGRKGDIIATDLGKEKIKGGISIEEGAIRMRQDDGTMKTIHSNDVVLDIPDAGIQEIVKKDIMHVYRPREEKEDNLKRKEELKKQAREERAAKGESEEGEGVEKNNDEGSAVDGEDKGLFDEE